MTIWLHCSSSSLRNSLLSYALSPSTHLAGSKSGGRMLALRGGTWRLGISAITGPVAADDRTCAEIGRGHSDHLCDGLHPNPSSRKPTGYERTRKLWPQWREKIS